MKSIIYGVTALFVILLVLVIVWPTHASTTTLTGTLKDGFGNGITGRLVLQLPVPAQDTTTNTAVSNAPVTCQLINGAVSQCPPLYDVANLQPQNLYYIARAYDSSGNLVFNGNYAITGGSYNLGAASPTTVTASNVSYISPAATNQTNTFCCTQIFQGQIQSTLATGTAPFSIASTTLVPNLNVNVIGGVTVSGTPIAGNTIVASSGSAAAWGTNPAQILASYTNEGVTGTSTNLLAKLTGAPSTVRTLTTADLTGIVGICVSGCGTTSTSNISTVGQASCLFDGAVTAGDYVQASGTVAGNCHDAGASYPATNQVLGRVLVTNAGGGVFNMTLFSAEITTGVGITRTASASGCTTASTSFSPCDNTLTWSGGGFADTAYFPSCTGRDTAIQASGGDGSSGEVPNLNIRSFTATQIVVVTQTMAARAATYNTIYCTGFHP